MKKRPAIILGILIIVLAASGCSKAIEGPLNVGQPGKYRIFLSYEYSWGSTGSITMTITSVEVLEDLTLKFNCQWTATLAPYYFLVKGSDQYSHRLYLVDNRGHRYDHFKGTGAAYANRTELRNGNTAVGAFYFPRIAQEANALTFYDKIYNRTIGPIPITH